MTAIAGQATLASVRECYNEGRNISFRNIVNLAGNVLLTLTGLTVIAFNEIKPAGCCYIYSMKGSTMMCESYFMNILNRTHAAPSPLSQEPEMNYPF